MGKIRGMRGALLVLDNASVSGVSESPTIETLPPSETSAAGTSIGGPYAGSLVSGTTLQSTPDSVWESFGPYTTELNDNVILVKGIVDTAGGYGGATLYQVNVGSLSSPSA